MWGKEAMGDAPETAVPVRVLVMMVMPVAVTVPLRRVVAIGHRASLVLHASDCTLRSDPHFPGHHSRTFVIGVDEGSPQGRLGGRLLGTSGAGAPPQPPQSPPLIV